MKIERGSLKYLVILIIIMSLCGFIIYPLLDFVFCKFITNSNFSYSFKEHILEPFTYSIILATCLFLLDKKK